MKCCHSINAIAAKLLASLLFATTPVIAQTPYEIVSNDGSCLKRMNGAGSSAGFSLALAPCTREEDQAFHVADPQTFWDIPFRHNGGGALPVSNYLGDAVPNWPSGYLYLKIMPTERAGEDVLLGKLATVTFQVRNNLSQIASETGSRTTFTPSSGQEVLYGANGAYVGRSDFTALMASGNKALNCSASTFGADPAAGVPKNCFTWNNVAPNDWLWRANENSSFNVSDTQLVRYGAAGRFHYRTFQPGATVSCNSASFGDPIADKKKYCYVGPTNVTMASANSSDIACLANPGTGSTGGLPAGSNAREGSASTLTKRGPCDGSPETIWKFRPTQ